MQKKLAKFFFCKKKTAHKDRPERSRVKYDNSVVDPFILYVTRLQENLVNRRINWDKVKEAFKLEFPQYDTVNSKQIQNLYTAAVTRAAKDSMKGSDVIKGSNVITGPYNGAPHTIDESCIVDADSSNDLLNANEYEDVELSDEVLMQIPMPKSPLKVAADFLGTIVNAVVGTNIFQSSTYNRSVHDFTTPFQIVTLDIALRDGPAPKRFTTDEIECLHETMKKFGQKTMHWDVKKYGKASFPHKYHQLAQTKYNADKSLQLYERDGTKLQNWVKDTQRKS